MNQDVNLHWTTDMLYINIFFKVEQLHFYPKKNLGFYRCSVHIAPFFMQWIGLYMYIVHT